MSQAGLVVLLVYLLSVMASAQKGSPEDDLKKVTASGTLEKNVYSNEHVGFRLALPEPPCDPKLNTKVDVQRPSAILLECEHVVKGWQGMYTLTVAIDYRANYPYRQKKRTFYEGVACTQMKEYLLCFVATGPSVNEVRAFQNMDRRLELITKPATK